MFRRISIGLVAAGLLAGALLAAYAIGRKEASNPQVNHNGSDVVSNSTPVSSTPTKDVASACGLIAINKAANSVVHITVAEGTGSGFLVTDRLVVTNRHVVEGSSTTLLQFSDGSKETGTTLATSSSLDIAIIQLHGCF